MALTERILKFVYKLIIVKTNTSFSSCRHWLQIKRKYCH